MLIRIEHSTSYKYSEPLLATTQYLRMTPLSGRTQAVENWALICPGATTTAWQDQYGNACHTLTVTKHVDRLDIRVSGLVRTRDTSGVVGVATPELPIMLYLRETPATVASDSIRDLAAACRGTAERDRIEVLHDIMLGIATPWSTGRARPMSIPPAPRRWSRAAACARTMRTSSARPPGRSTSRPVMSAAT
nr:transglutaminase N-terminal domain-containing protein [Methyloceanibacter methanicus]